jgi:hypothetical protein
MVPVGLETDFWKVPEVKDAARLYLLKLLPGLLCDENSCFAEPVFCSVVIGLDSALRFFAICAKEAIQWDTIDSSYILLGTTVYVKSTLVGVRVARWYIFKQKIPIWVHYEGSCNVRCWYIFMTFCILLGHFVYFMTFWYIVWSLGIFFPVLVCCTKKNLATLVGGHCFMQFNSKEPVDYIECFTVWGSSRPRCTLVATF